MKPEVLTAGGTLLSGAAAVSQGSGPIQIALAAILVIGALVLGGVILSRTVGRQD